MALIPEDFLNSVVAIGTIDENKKSKWIGTGFLYAHFLSAIDEKKRNYAFFLVTNRHVIQNRKEIIVRFNSSEELKSKDLKIPLFVNGNKIWTDHEDPKVDVAVLKLNLNKITEQGLRPGFFRSDDHTLTIDQLKKNGILEGDFIYAMGYPMGIVNAERQYVIVRSGIVSRIRDLYDNKSKEFIIDAFVFPGNSGGPVLSKPEVHGIKGTTIQKSSSLIGIVKGYLPYRDVALSQQTKRPRVIFEENTGLTSVIPVDFIQQTIERDLKKTKQA